MSSAHINKPLFWKNGFVLEVVQANSCSLHRTEGNCHTSL